MEKRSRFSSAQGLGCDRASHLLTGCQRRSHHWKVDKINNRAIHLKGRMETFHDRDRNPKEPPSQKPVSTPDKELKAIAYRMDALIPGFYAWFGSLRIRIGGSEAEETHPGTIRSFAGVPLVLPGYQIFSTYQRNYDPG